MNQILDVGGKSAKSDKSSTNSNKLVIFFVICIIIFAISIIGVAVNLLSKVHSEETESKGNQVDQPIQNPEANIQIKFEGEVGQVKSTITSDNNIQNIDYWWDDEEPTSVQPNDTKYELVVPSRQGTRTLNIEVTDENGNKKTATQVVIGDSAPELQLTVDGIGNYVIKATDDNEIDKIKIVLNNETNVIEVKDKEIEYKVPIPQGDSVIEVTVYNLNGLTSTKKGKISRH